MTFDGDETPAADPPTTDEGQPEAGSETAVAEPPEVQPMDLAVEISDIGPCRKHVRVTVPRADLDRFYETTVDKFVSTAEVPGFRKGRVPRRLIGRRFRRELADEVKQKVLIGSLEQLSAENHLDPINEPDLDVENLDIPQEGDFQYEFDVEVRPQFELPTYEGLKIRRPTREVTDEEIDEFLERFLAQYGRREPYDGPAEQGDFITAAVVFTHKATQTELRTLPELTVRLNRLLRFHDAELDGFDDLLSGATAGASRQAELSVSLEAATLALRGETIQARFTVKSVSRLKRPELTHEFLQRLGVESEDELRAGIGESLERQVKYQQRQSTRVQVLEQITESANWDLPEELVARQVENAIHRELLEMRQAGFTTQQIQARENEIRQRSISTTRQAMKEHFVLDKIATQEKIEVAPSDLEFEIRLMAMQSGESPRRLRARLTKSGVIENLEAQIRERKAVDVILDQAVYEDVQMPRPTDDSVEAVDASICGSSVEATPGPDDQDAEDASE